MGNTGPDSRLLPHNPTRCRDADFMLTSPSTTRRGRMMGIQLWYPIPQFRSRHEAAPHVAAHPAAPNSRYNTISYDMIRYLTILHP